ncbi:hypothetical protein CPLU01_09351 [Colletotrichum plurivorum]|uniref:DUF676 domain-containing protein n=1 Tax=Colletotrichum plurivorum TaxID=2175906 RepID=A0A8H6K8G5_9PEZI|nr:hypothetical protein CPLU01_09351 [Colletotrichum plurivorum]
MLTFGYDAKIWHPTQRVSRGTIRHHARRLMEDLDRERTSCGERPLIFVAHSLGGLIVKEMLMLTDKYGEACKRIASSTRALLFFGTPHRGSYYADKGAFAATRLRTFRRIANKMLLKQLGPTSDVIESLETDFPLWVRTREAANHSIEICCFFEMKHMGIMKQLVSD